MLEIFNSVFLPIYVTCHICLVLLCTVHSLPPSELVQEELPKLSKAESKKKMCSTNLLMPLELPKVTEVHGVKSPLRQEANFIGYK